MSVKRKSQFEILLPRLRKINVCFTSARRSKTSKWTSRLRLKYSLSFVSGSNS